MLSVIHFLFSQSQIFNFILLESESRGFRNLIIKEVYIKLTFMIDMRILNAQHRNLMMYIHIHFQAPISNPIYFDDCKERCSLGLCHISNGHNHIIWSIQPYRLNGRKFLIPRMILAESGSQISLAPISIYLHQSSGNISCYFKTSDPLYYINHMVYMIDPF